MESPIDNLFDGNCSLSLGCKYVQTIKFTDYTAIIVVSVVGININYSGNSRYRLSLNYFITDATKTVQIKPFHFQIPDNVIQINFLNRNRVFVLINRETLESITDYKRQAFSFINVFIESDPIKKIFIHNLVVVYCGKIIESRVLHHMKYAKFNRVTFLNKIDFRIPKYFNAKCIDLNKCKVIEGLPMVNNYCKCICIPIKLIPEEIVNAIQLRSCYHGSDMEIYNTIGGISLVD